MRVLIFKNYLLRYLYFTLIIIFTFTIHDIFLFFLLIIDSLFCICVCVFPFTIHSEKKIPFIYIEYNS